MYAKQDITLMKLKTISTKLKNVLDRFLARISYRQKVTLVLLSGVIIGLTGLFFGSSVKCVDVYHAVHIVLI